MILYCFEKKNQLDISKFAEIRAATDISKKIQNSIKKEYTNRSSPNSNTNLL